MDKNKLWAGLILGLVGAYIIFSQFPYYDLRNIASLTAINWIAVGIGLIILIAAFIVTKKSFKKTPEEQKATPLPPPSIKVKEVEPRPKPIPITPIRPRQIIPEQEKEGGFEQFRDLLEEDEQKEDISDMGKKLAADFEKTVSKMTNQLEKETEELMKKKEQADNISNNINSTVKKMWDVYQKLDAHRNILDKKIRANKVIEQKLKDVQETREA